MRAIFTNTEIILVADSTRETRTLSKFADAMSFKIEGCEFSEAFRKGRWDGKERLIKRLRSSDVSKYLTHARALTGHDKASHGAAGCIPGDSAWRAPVGLGENVLEKWPRITQIDARRYIGTQIDMHLDPNVIPRLRPYQQDAHDAILYPDPPLTGKGLIRLPTRAGKTVIAASVFAEVGARGGFIVNSDMLLQQTVRFFRKVLVAEEPVPDDVPLVGQWGGGKREPGWITVLSVQSITRHLDDPERVFRSQSKRVKKRVAEIKRERFDGDELEVREKIDKRIRNLRCGTVSVQYSLQGGRMKSSILSRNNATMTVLRSNRDKIIEFLSSWDVVFFDECHHLTSDLWREAMTLADSPFKIGLSATIFFDHDGGTPKPSIMLMASTGPVVFTLTPSELISQGWLCRPRITFCEAPEPLENEPIADSFLSIYEWGIVSNGPRNDLIVEKIIEQSEAGKRCLVTIKLVKHANNIVKICKAAGVKAGVIIGQTTAKKRDQLIAQLKARELDVIIGTVFKEAVDLPFLETVIIGDAGSSKILTLQRLRNMTPVDENDNVILKPMEEANIVDVIEFADMCHRFLRKHTRLRLDEYKRHPAFIVRYERE